MDEALPGDNMTDDFIHGADDLAEAIAMAVKSQMRTRSIAQNWSIRATDPQFDMLRHSVNRILVVALYIVIIIVGAVGNSVVVFIVVRNRSLHTVTNVFIANLALSDIGLCVFSLPIQLYYQLSDHWQFSETLCRIVFAAFAVPMYVSTLTIFLIALDRYWLIVYPLRQRMPLTMAMALIIVVALTSVLLSTPVLTFTHVATWNDTDLDVYRQYCVETWPSVTGRLAYSVSMFVLQFCTPLIATTLLYYRIYCRLKRRHSRRATRHNDAKQKTNKLLVAIVTVFIICWLPWTLLTLVTEIDSEVVRGAHYKFIDVLLRAFAMGSACVNPFIYCWLNENFRKEFDHIAICLRFCHRRGNSFEITTEAADTGKFEKNGLLSPNIMVEPASRSQVSSTIATNVEMISIHRGTSEISRDDTSTGGDFTEEKTKNKSCSTSELATLEQGLPNTLGLPKPIR